MHRTVVQNKACVKLFADECRRNVNVIAIFIIFSPYCA